VNAIWLCDGYTPAHPMERVLPDGSAQLIINLREDSTRVYDPHDAAGCRRMRGSVVSGPRSEFTVIDTAEQACVVGVAGRRGPVSRAARLRAAQRVRLP
jgi:hypothetical protein